MGKAKNINILGTEYQIVVRSEKDDPFLSETGGFCDHTTKKIVLNDFSMGHPNSIEDLDELKIQCLRHEIIHAVLYESGLYDHFQDEILVNWLSIQLPKIVDMIINAQSVLD